MLPRYTLQAQVQWSQARCSQLELDERSGLRTPHGASLGHVPEEFRALRERLAHGPWTLDPSPPPRHVGAVGMCVPDAHFVHRDTGTTVALELFHRWHHAPLQRRVQELAQRPDPYLLLGIDKRLADSDATAQEAMASMEGRVFRFNAFPTASGLRRALASWEAPL